MKEIRVCPECGQAYSEPPALSRKDNRKEICPICGMLEALEVKRVAELRARAGAGKVLNEQAP